MFLQSLALKGTHNRGIALRLIQEEWQTFDKILDEGKWEPKEPAQRLGHKGFQTQVLYTPEL